MDKSQIAIWVQTNSKYFPEGQALNLQSRLENLDERQFMAITTLDFKDPTTMLLVSIFLGGLGIDRFMLGDTGMGILKLLTLGCCGILTIIDWFSITNKTKQCNLIKIDKALSTI